MRYSFYLILTLLFGVKESNAQRVGRVTMDVEVGSAISVGKQKFRLWNSNDDLFGLLYAYHDRYKYPSVRLRAAIKKSLSPLFTAGIRSGFEAHFREYNPNNNNAIAYVIPLQLMAEVKALKISEEIAAFVNFAAGHELNGGWTNKFPDGSFYQKKPGPILSLEAKVAKTAKLSSVYYKCGFEYEQNPWTMQNMRRPIAGLQQPKVDLIHYKVIKTQIFFAVGITF